jgi:NitT/TauT family transport system permease protein
MTMAGTSAPKGMSSRQRIWLYRIVVLVVLIGVWEFASERSVITRFFVGSPLEVALTIVDWCWSGLIWPHLAVTLIETLLAFAIGTALALVIGLWLALDPFWSGVFDPFIKSVNTMPRLILAPIFSVWFGLGIWSKVALGVTIVFFIVFFNVYQGVKEVSPILLANVRMLGANRAQLIHRVYIPSAMSWVFSSLHLSVGMAFVGAVIGEYLGSAAGVGYLILQAESTFDINAVIAGIVILTACALVLDAMVTLVENRLVGRSRPRAAQARGT